MVKLTEFAKRKPDQLSGGQRQRVALARSLIKRPKVLLLDEPLGALDKSLREDTQFELMKIQKELGITFVIVTHDQEEAMTLSDRIGVMDRGQIVQVGPPRELYEMPSNLFIANFLGALNSVKGRVVSTTADGCCNIKLKGVDMHIQIVVDLPFEDGQRVVVTARPEKLEIFADPDGKSEMRNSYKGTVQSIGYMGHLTVYKVELEAGIVVTVTESNIHMSAKSGIHEGDTVRVDWPGRSSGIFSA
jgi:putrescine transport system ATP-binding protein